MSSTENFQFKAETKQLLDIVINSLYSEKEIFLRELISNSSDALDKLRFKSLTDKELNHGNLEIWLTTDSENRSITITDNGIGMNKEDLLNNIGTIAKSGTRDLLAKDLKNKDSGELSQLIGQFGVGFYASFMIADEVSILTKKAGDENGWLWTSKGDGDFTVTESKKESCGTEIKLNLKDADSENGIEDYTQEWTLKGLVKKYSDFIRYPVKMNVEREEYDKDEKGEIIKDSEPKKIIEEETLNSMKPIWSRKKEDVSEQELKDFYKGIAHDWMDPMRDFWTKAEGTLEFSSVLFLPTKAPFDLYYQTFQHGLQLYVRNVLIKEKTEELLPNYLRFVRGVVESPDLPLNVSRELLQKNKQIKQIQKKIVKKIMEELSYMLKEEREDYLKFWAEFGKVLKEGVSGDQENQEKVSKLLLFSSTADENKLVSFSEYVEKMKEDQKEIFYLTGESKESLLASPHLEAFTEKGYEVLLMTDPVDELLVQHLNKFEEKPLKSIAKGNVELGNDEEKKQKEEELKNKKEELGTLLEKVQKSLDEHVKEARLSSRLTSSPVCLVVEEHEASPNLEKLLKQAGNSSMPKQKYIMELNPNHPVLEKMQVLHKENPEDELLCQYSELLLGQALLAEGVDLPNPRKFSKIITNLMVS